MGTAGTKITLSPSDFKRANRGAPDTAETSVLFTENSAYYSPGRADSGHELLQRKDNLFPGSSVDAVSSSVALRTGPRRTLSPGRVGEY
ncbi:hypothetical protein JTE90_001057 [Oedothorax gibbosus]|uniref:Uncharacterized protein n=1 Tax=Oedothorax gibbosus TaxID=931172 RepID=A0AAV6TGE0_9ARAC|nr:hypothetical protein JTE90_001057 [Oedothorax gibbosus]